MRKVFKSIFQTGFRKLGFYPLQKFPSAELLYKKLKDKPYALLRYQLKKTIRFVEAVGDQIYYTDLLRTFVPTWDVVVQESSFIGEGRGEDNLNTYRKLKIDGTWYFEKVFFNYAKDLESVEWFLTHVYDKYEFAFTVPKIRKKYTGALLTIVYFELFDLRPLSDEELEQHKIKLTAELYQVTVTNDFNAKSLNTPDFLKTYMGKFYVEKKYKDFIEEAKRILVKKDIDTAKLDRLASESRPVLAHGSIHRKNIFKNNIVVDWDFFGLYPIGTDIPMIYLRLRRDSLTIKDLGGWLRTNYSAVILKEDWNDFKRNVFYFLFIYNYSKYGKWEFFSRLEREIINELRSH